MTYQTMRNKPFKLSIMRTQLEQLQAAKEISLNISKGQSMRARYNDEVTNYTGLKDKNGRSWVLGDSEEDIQNPDAVINGCPAREVFGNFSMMQK